MIYLIDIKNVQQAREKGKYFIKIIKWCICSWGKVQELYFVIFLRRIFFFYLFIYLFILKEETRGGQKSSQSHFLSLTSGGGRCQTSEGTAKIKPNFAMI
jgi:hypothetical protein